MMQYKSILMKRMLNLFVWLFQGCSLANKMKWSYLIILCLMLVSCQNTETIRRKAIRYKAHSELNNIIEYYSMCYYKLPKSVDDIVGFLNKWKAQSPNTYTYSISGRDIMDELFSNDLQMATYDDSLFIFNKHRQIGCVVYGHPLYWFAHKDEYPIDRLDYWYQFQACAYDAGGDYLFDWDPSILYHTIFTVTGGLLRGSEDSKVDIILWSKGNHVSSVFTGLDVNHYVPDSVLQCVYKYLDTSLEIDEVILPMRLLEK